MTDTAHDHGLVKYDLTNASLGDAARWVIDHTSPVSALASPDHGPRHWHDVARIGYALWLMEPTEDRADLKVIFLFAALHDSQRENEYGDPEHGERAAGVLLDMLQREVITLTDEQISRLEVALADHDKGGTHRDPVIGICWDADRFTLNRVGITIDPTMLSTATGRNDANKFIPLAHKIMYGPDLAWQEIADIYEGNELDPAR